MFESPAGETVVLRDLSVRLLRLDVTNRRGVSTRGAGTLAAPQRRLATGSDFNHYHAQLALHLSITGGQ
jgi:hypothetical protein